MRTGLPSGEVTFLFTDIEGSTRLIRRFGADYVALLERHRELLRTAWGEHGGVEFGSEGDALFVAFEGALPALTAATELQRRVDEEPWPPGGDIRVRVGVHTGPAYPHGRDYIALAVHQAARVVGAANGGQVVASAAAVAAAGSAGALDVRPLGAYRLRDFDGPAELFEVVASGRRAGPFAALRAVPTSGHNVDLPADAFVGRDDELAGLAGLVAPGRLVTVTGPGGMGKTRLALEFTVRHAARWADGIWVVDLSGIPAGQSVLPAVADALGAGIGEDDPRQVVLEHLRPRRTLLVLDNCEHVLDGARDLASHAIGSCRGVGLLATSRQRLGIAGEHTFVLAPLPLSEACVELFVERARRRDPTASLDRPGDHELVLEIGRRLDGMPLAIELAAARIDVMSPAELLADLSTRLASLRARDHRPAARQRTLGALLDWSYGMLEPAERAVLRRLAVFIGSFDVATAAAAAGHGEVDRADVPEHVWSLADKSLVAVDRREGETRYRLLETIRSVALTYLDAERDGPATRHLLGLRYLADFPWETRGNRGVRARLVLEHATITDLVEGLRADGQIDLALALARIGVEHWIGAVSSHAAVAAIEAQIDRFDGGAGLARLHAAVAKLLAEAGELERARRHLDRARELVAAHGEDDRLGRVPLLRSQVQLSLRIATDDELRSTLEAIRAELARPLAPSLRADLLVDLSMVQGTLGDDDAIGSLADAAALADRLDDHVLRMTILNNLAEQELRVGDTVAAATHQREAMRLSTELGVPVMTAFALVLAARMAQPSGGDDATVRLHAAADAMLEACDFELIPDDRVLSDVVLDAARARLGPAYETLADAGRRLSTAEAAAQAELVFTAVIDGAEPVLH